MLRAVAVIIFLLVAGFLVIVYSEMMPISMQGINELKSETASGFLFDREMTRYPAKIEVIESSRDMVGFSGETNMVDFGIVPQGGISKKFISILNSRSTTVHASIIVNGMDMVKADRERLVIRPGANITIGLSANVSESMKTGNQSGSVDVFVVIPKYEFLSIFFESPKPQITGEVFGRRP